MQEKPGRKFNSVAISRDWGGAGDQGQACPPVSPLRPGSPAQLLGPFGEAEEQPGRAANAAARPSRVALFKVCWRRRFGRALWLPGNEGGTRSCRRLMTLRMVWRARRRPSSVNEPANLPGAEEERDVEWMTSRSS